MAISPWVSASCWADWEAVLGESWEQILYSITQVGNEVTKKFSQSNKTERWAQVLQLCCTNPCIKHWKKPYWCHSEYPWRKAVLQMNTVTIHPSGHPFPFQCLKWRQQSCGQEHWQINVSVLDGWEDIFIPHSDSLAIYLVWGQQSHQVSCAGRLLVVWKWAWKWKEHSQDVKEILEVLEISPPEESSTSLITCWFIKVGWAEYGFTFWCYLQNLGFQGQQGSQICSGALWRQGCPK